MKPACDAVHHLMRRRPMASPWDSAITFPKSLRRTTSCKVRALANLPPPACDSGSAAVFHVSHQPRPHPGSPARDCTKRATWKRETWELENYPEGEKKEMIELYVEEGMTVEDATTIVNAFAKCECALPSILSRICFVSGYCAACIRPCAIAVTVYCVPGSPCRPGEVCEPDDGRRARARKVGPAGPQGHVEARRGHHVLVLVLRWRPGHHLRRGQCRRCRLAKPDLSDRLHCHPPHYVPTRRGQSQDAFIVCVFAPRQVTNTSMFIQGGVMMINGTIACAASYFIAWAIKELMGDLTVHSSPYGKPGPLILRDGRDHPTRCCRRLSSKLCPGPCGPRVLRKQRLEPERCDKRGNARAGNASEIYCVSR
eukprot:scaffold133445_cov67-Phaeocystis_antarctica.AAC.4